MASSLDTSRQRPRWAGPIAVIRNGDPITIDAEARKISLNIPATELKARLAKWKAPKPAYTRGVLAKYAKLVSTASKGAVTD
jgi:dihydroxy-acid dehydratase